MVQSSLLLKVLGAPKFVYRYARRRNTVSNLQRKVEAISLAAKYSEYLSNSNTFVLFRWRKEQGVKFDKDYYWQDFASNCSVKNQPAIFIQEKLNNEAMRICLQSPFLQDTEEYRCAFQSISEPDLIPSMLNLNIVNKCNLEIHSLGLRTDGNDIAAYIQSFLEESESMYKDLSYKKLLSIARKSQNDKDSSVKELLNNLAENGLSRPSIVGNNEWLVLTRAQ